jgi:uncharacterized protein YbaP (TraB family)
MKTLIIFLTAASFFSTLGAQQITLENTNLWKISGKGSTKDSYIFLTGPNCDASLKPSEKLSTALQNVSGIALEYDLYASDASKIGTNNYAAQELDKAKNNLTASEYADFVKVLKDKGYPENAIDEFQKYKLSMIFYAIQLALGPCRSEPMEYELQFKPLAKKQKLKLDVLENVDEFIKELNGYDNNYWKNNIHFFLSNKDLATNDAKKELDLYKSEDLKNLQQLYKTSKLFQLQYDNKPFKQHVITLSKKIDQKLKGGPVLITCSYSNVMMNGSSLFEELKKNGYTITPVLN